MSSPSRHTRLTPQDLRLRSEEARTEHQSRIEWENEQEIRKQVSAAIQTFEDKAWEVAQEGRFTCPVSEYSAPKSCLTFDDVKDKVVREVFNRLIKHFTDREFSVGIHGPFVQSVRECRVFELVVTW